MAKNDMNYSIDITKDIITDSSKLESLSRTLSGRIRELDKEVHVYLLSEGAHIEKHRNPTRLNKFLSAVTGSGARVTAMHAFIQTFFNVKLNEKKMENTEKDGSTYVDYYIMRPERKQWSWVLDGKKATTENYGDLQRIMASYPWFKFQPERDPQAFILEDKFSSFLKSAIGGLNKAYIDGKTNQRVGHKVDTDFLAELVELAKKHNMKLDDMVPRGAVIPDEELARLGIKAAGTGVSSNNPPANAGGIDKPTTGTGNPTAPEQDNAEASTSQQNGRGRTKARAA